MNLRDLSTEELEQHRIDVLVEQERRQSLATIPAQISSLATQYASNGGNPQDIKTVIDGL